MSVLGIDLGGTKVSAAVFTDKGILIKRDYAALDGREGREVGRLIADLIRKFRNDTDGDEISSVGICVPGISRSKTGTVWAPNIPGWEDYPLLEELNEVCLPLPVSIDSDRACCILGEHWQGNTQGCSDAIFLAVGTGIGAGIMINGSILRGAHDIAGAIGWMALDRPFFDKYKLCGNFEYYASGDGIARLCREILVLNPHYRGKLFQKPSEHIVAADVFGAYEEGDKLAEEVLQICVEFWGMVVANLVSLFNPEKIILGGGVFGPAAQFVAQIKAEADKWAQPISSQQVKLEISGMGGNAGLYGAGFLALNNSIKPKL